ncbi:hypothetical protein GAP31_202 [Cronobacter phage vB_CsaM_GAP31]|uniref:Inh N-terminal domain-containing protein n=1 Tax=Cronobacter phage vB_CsaM_GAP31 TaxID=1141135 RepID=K4F677_9CAUD|nr:hypothetical protein GAP31_202 [Cronobacter phage vB_CsaM_GAP31]AFC21383.1 hypothetical protein GAP31_202 [Cronobacter phage vB_CsaM_GAP31]
MANQNYRIFPNKVELFKFFGTYAPELNVGVSARLPLNGFCVGKEHKAFRNSVDFFKALAEISGLDVDAEHSTLRMGTYIVFFNSALPNPNRRGKAVEATVAPKVDASVVEVKSASYEAILTEAEALNDEADKKGSKDKLADLAATKGITLAKNKSFENMMADFKAALEELEPAK